MCLNRCEVHVNIIFSLPDLYPIYHLTSLSWLIYLYCIINTFTVHVPQITPLLSSTGYQHIALIEQCIIDLALITALVERWRPETHTFHLPWSECIATLEDVALHLGVRVDGHAIIEPNFLHWDELCNELLGEVPPDNARKKAALKLTWLLSILCAPLSEEPTIHKL